MDNQKSAKLKFMSMTITSAPQPWPNLPGQDPWEGTMEMKTKLRFPS